VQQAVRGRRAPVGNTQPFGPVISSAVYFITRKGDVRRYHPDSRKTDLIVNTPHSRGNEEAFGAFAAGEDFLALGPGDELLIIDDERSSQVWALKREGW